MEEIKESQSDPDFSQDDNNIQKTTTRKYIVILK